MKYTAVKWLVWIWAQVARSHCFRRKMRPSNWIKVVQRLPVRIELDQKQLEQYPLRIGLSTLVSVNTTNRDGQVLANKVRSTLGRGKYRA
ncbi:hypothetical protein ACOI39_19870 [Escherichia coli]